MFRELLTRLCLAGDFRCAPACAFGRFQVKNKQENFTTKGIPAFAGTGSRHEGNILGKVKENLAADTRLGGDKLWVDFRIANVRIVSGNCYY